MTPGLIFYLISSSVSVKSKLRAWNLLYLVLGSVVGRIINLILLALASCMIFSMLYWVTSSGMVSYSAMDRGTPNSSTARLASGEMTERAQKSTLFPIKFYLNRPSLPFRRARILLRGCEPFCLILPAFSESMILATSFINSGTCLSRSASLKHALISLFFCMTFL